MASPASNGGRGLKLLPDLDAHGVRRASPASNGGRGLKHAKELFARVSDSRIARQQWRARIETPKSLSTRVAEGAASPASNGGRGLKLGQVLRLHDGHAHRPPAMAGAD